MTTPSSVRSFSVFADEWHLPVVKVPKRKDRPADGEHRQMAKADALKLADRERIAADARRAAAEIMAAFTERTGR